MTLTPEQIDLLNRLQLFFKAKMGEWQKTDIFLRGERGGLVDSIGSEVMRLRLVWNGLDSGTTLIYKPYWDELLRIPKPIDWQNPERGLWGMVNWNNWQIGHNFIPGYLAVISIQKLLKIHSDPFTALLKVLAEQEEV